MRLAGFFYGFTLPISGVLQAVSLTHRTAGSLLFLVVTLPLLIYAVRVWRRFWGLPTWAAFLLLFFSSLVGALVGLVFVFLFSLLFGR
jgi:ABC-type transport system involved in cytochrome c biogenesis permease subunit